MLRMPLARQHLACSLDTSHLCSTSSSDFSRSASLPLASLEDRRWVTG
jgi:hypothetical protein